MVKSTLDSQRMRICFVSHDSGRQGAELALLDLIVNLMKRYSYDLQVVLPSKKGGLFDKLNSEGIKCTVIPYNYWMGGKNQGALRIIKRTIHNLIASLRLSRFLISQRCELVYSNSVTVNVGAVAAWMVSIPHIWHLHELWKSEFDLNFDYGSKFSFRLMDRWTDAFIAVSEDVRTLYSESLPASKIHMIYQSVKLNFNVECKNGIVFGDHLNIAMVGRISSGKRQRDAVQAIRILRRKGIKVKLWLFGDYESSYGELLKKEIESSELAGSIEFLGYIENYTKYFTKMLFSIVCSSTEGFGRVCVESMLSRVPVVAANGGATRELIRNNFSGLLYETNDIDSLVEKMELLLNDKALRERLTENALVYSKELFSEDRYALKINALLCSVVQKSKICNSLVSTEIDARPESSGVSESKIDARPFVLVGTAKSGTTAIANWLSKSPQIKLTNPKETHYFDGPEYVENELAFVDRFILPIGSNVKSFGEVATSYLYAPFAPNRIFNCLGKDTQILIVLRNPVARAFSDWWMMYSFGIEDLGFRDAIQADLSDVDFAKDLLGKNGPNLWATHLTAIAANTMKFRTYVDYGMYASQVSRYFDVFGRENVTVYFYEEIFGKNSNFRESVEQVLGLTKGALRHQIDVTNEKYNSRIIGMGVRKVGSFVPFRGSIRPLSKFLHRIGRPPGIDQDTARRLADIYSEDSKDLAIVLKRPLPYTLDQGA